jgi:hypothetical protein
MVILVLLLNGLGKALFNLNDFGATEISPVEIDTAPPSVKVRVSFTGKFSNASIRPSGHHITIDCPSTGVTESDFFIYFWRF